MFPRTLVAVTTAALLSAVSTAAAQVPITSTTNVSVNVLQPETMTLTVDQTSLLHGTALSPLSISGSTLSLGSAILSPRWDLRTGRSVQVYSFATDLTGADASGDLIPATAFEAQWTGGTLATTNSGMTPFASTTLGGATRTGVLLLNVASTNSTTRALTTAAQDLSVALQLNFTSVTVKPNQYSGTLTFEAKVQ